MFNLITYPVRLLTLGGLLAITQTAYCTENTNILNASVTEASIVLGSGCFWGAEKGYEQLPGVIGAISGYADGRGLNADYKTITQTQHRFNPDNYAEVVKVTYNPKLLPLEDLLKYFFEHHNPTQGNRQGNDIGTQYRSTILFSTDNEKKTAEILRDIYQDKLSAAGYGYITTHIKALDTFHPAEEYHQDYLKKNPNGYCPNHATGVTFDKKDTEKVDNQQLMTGKHIVVLEAPFCPYCEAFKMQVVDDYQGEIPMHTRLVSQLDLLDLNTPTWATPTIFFIENGKEIFGHQGFMTPKEFYQVLGEFQLGKDSKAYEIAFEDGTESRFCRQYDLFKNTGDGVFIDALSGEPLFDTKDRFNSGSGWLSFTQAIPDSVIEIPDNRFGMERIEVRSKTTDIHLGHVFEDGPNGSRRFCINANVLKFQPRESDKKP